MAARKARSRRCAKARLVSRTRPTYLCPSADQNESPLRMTGLFTPSPLFLALIAMKTTGYLALLLPLAALRVIGAHGPSRALALAAVGLALLGLYAHQGPAILGWTSGTGASMAQSYKTALSGFAPLIAASTPLALSGVARGRRWWGVDAGHAALALGMILLWGLTL